MEKILFLVFVAVLAPNRIQVDAIVGGTAALAGIYPAQVSLTLPNNGHCGASIYDRNHIITAASCCIDANNNLLSNVGFGVRSGILTLVNNQPMNGVTAIYLHPLFNPFTFENDIAVLRVQANYTVDPEVASPLAAPAMLQDRIVPAGSATVVVGWNPPGQMTLQQLNAPVLAPTVCNAANTSGERVRERMMCTGPMTANTGTCLGARGGGLYWEGRLAGILSNNFGCGAANTPSVYTSIRFYNDWIRAQSMRNDVPPPGSTAMPGVTPVPPFLADEVA